RISQMTFTCVLLLFYVQVSTSSPVLNTLTKPSVPLKCPACQNSTLCGAKYEVFPGHTACKPKSSDARPHIVMTDAERDAIVRHHNELRGSVNPKAANMLLLRWDKELEMLAKRWADVCIFQHDRVRIIPGRFHVGQNLAWGSFPTFKAATDAWFAEKDDYAPYFGTRLEHFPEGKQIGHYTQIAWAETSLIGCSSAKCGNTNYYVCNYAPGGNVTPFTKPYIPATTSGEMCKTRTQDGLCDCGNLDCENMSEINVTSCTCNCGAATQAPPHCTLDCSKSDDFYCGTQESFKLSQCHQPFVVSRCPHLCGICPCGEQKYRNVMCNGASKSYGSSKIFLLMTGVSGFAITLRVRFSV
ncbi:unnamed protein product, partial [Candidula unifasciata]